MMTDISSNLSYRNTVLHECLLSNGVFGHPKYNQIASQLAVVIRESLSKLGGSDFRAQLNAEIRRIVASVSQTSLESYRAANAAILN